jgi:hypothetical protein
MCYSAKQISVDVYQFKVRRCISTRAFHEAFDTRLLRSSRHVLICKTSLWTANWWLFATSFCISALQQARDWEATVEVCLIKDTACAQWRIKNKLACECNFQNPIQAPYDRLPLIPLPLHRFSHSVPRINNRITEMHKLFAYAPAWVISRTWLLHAILCHHDGCFASLSEFLFFGGT